MSVKITIDEAAKMLEITPMGLRLALRQGKFKEFGEAWKNEEKWTYYINKTRLEIYLKGGQA
ncbi:MAG: hypothetical protein EWM50_05525 [Gottschalkiaceae bacterium]|nr:MAG: hypothetical protein EWM50_05525 [Gottschalkiaceae bacterium]